MLRSRTAQILLVATVVLLSLCLPAPALAQEPAACTSPDGTLLLDPGLACNFALQIDVCGNANRVYREFTDKNGNVVRWLSAGKGNTLTFTNLANGKTLTTRPNGAVTKEAINPDGTITGRNTGHNVVILFPTDVPAGPSTVLYVGQVTYTRDSAYNFLGMSNRGTQTDICAVLQ